MTFDASVPALSHDQSAGVLPEIVTVPASSPSCQTDARRGEGVSPMSCDVSSVDTFILSLSHKYSAHYGEEVLRICYRIARNIAIFKKIRGLAGKFFRLRYSTK